MIQIRNSCFETNSSSSHAVCISMDSEIDPSIWDLIKDDKLYIYPREGGFVNFKTNKCLDKLQFLVSLVCTDVSTVHGSKEVKHLRTELKNILGVESVYLGHIDEYYEALRKRNKRPFTDSLDRTTFQRKYFKLCTIPDNQISAQLKKEIFETRETLKSFILSPNSWLYSHPNDSLIFSSSRQTFGGDYDQLIEFECEKYSRHTDLNSVVSIEYSPELRVDIEVNLMSEIFISLKDIIKYNDNFGMLHCIDIDLEDNRLVYCSDSDRELVEVIGDRYSLIKVFKKNDFTEYDGKFIGKFIGKIRNTNYELPRYKGTPPDADHCEIYPINIRSSKFFGECIL